MAEILKETVWVIVTKDRKFIGKGVPRNRYLIAMDDTKDKKRILTYQSKGRAEAGYKSSWFYGAGNYTAEDMEAVEVEMTMSIKAVDA